MSRWGLLGAYLFSLPNRCNQTYTIYLKVNTSGDLLVPLQIISTKSLIKDIHLSQNLSGIYYGILLILILYSTITFVYTREKIYLLYVSFVVSFALWQLSFDSLGFYYFWTDNYWMREKGTAFFIHSSTITLIIFSQSLLQANIRIKKYNNVLLKPLQYIAIVGLFASVIAPYKYTIVLGALLGIVTPIALFIAGVIVLKQGHKTIRLFVIGWGVFLVATVLFALSKFNLIYGFTIMKYGQQIGSVIDLVLLSVGLAYRFRELQNEYTQKLKDYTKTLEEQVQVALVKAREQDNLLIEQAKLASMGEMIEQIAHQWRQPLNNIGLINQNIYFKNKLDNLSNEDFEKLHDQIDINIQYLSDTINNFRTYYQKNQNKETYFLNDAIKTVIYITEATFKYYQINMILHTDKNAIVYNTKSDLFQVLLNILNNAKDALLESKTKNKTITINISLDTENTYIEICDNAGGIALEIIDNIFDSYFSTKSKETGTGIGLYMAKTITEKKLQGKLTVYNQEDGACFYIQLPLGKDLLS